MITYISDANAVAYQRRFEKAVTTLKSKHPEGAYNDLEIGSLEEYFAYLKDLASLTDAENPDLGRFFTMLPLDEGLFEIDANTRKISVPSEFVTNGVGVEGDEMAEVVYFSIDRFFDAIDLARKDMNIAIQWQVNNGGNIQTGVSRNYVKDIETIPGKIIFGWPISSELTKYSGTIKFAVRFYMVGTDSVEVDGVITSVPSLTYSFSTLPAEIRIQSTLDYDLFSDAAIDVIDHGSDLTSRIENSVINDPSIPAPTPPIFILNLGNDTSYTVRYVDGVYQWEEYQAGLADHTLITDLGNDGTYTLTAQAAPTGTGTNLTFDWRKIPYKPSGVLSNNEVSLNPVYEEYYEEAPLVPGGVLDSSVEYFTKRISGSNEIYEAYIQPALGSYTINSSGLVVPNGSETGIELFVKIIQSEQVDRADFRPADLTNAINEKQVYYTRLQETNGHYTYTILNDLSEAEVSDSTSNIVTINGTPYELYERYTYAIVDDAGNYHVDAIAKARLKEARTESAHVIIPAPRKPIIEEPVEDDGIFVAANGLSYTKDNNVVTIHAILNENRNVVLPVKAYAPEKAAGADPAVYGVDPKVTLAYQWYSNESEEVGTEIFNAADGTIADAYMVPPARDYEVMDNSNGSLNVTLPSNLNDVQFYAKVSSLRNKRIMSDYTYKYRVTPAPEAPEIRVGNVVRSYKKQDNTPDVIERPLIKNNSYNTLSIQVANTHKSDNSPIQHDKFTYLWMKMRVDTAETTPSDWEDDLIKLQVDLDEFGTKLGLDNPTGEGDIVASPAPHSLDAFIQYIEEIENAEIIEDEEKAKLTLTSNEDTGIYYCIVLNELNNNVAVNISPFFRVVN